MKNYASLGCACALVLLSTVPSLALASWFPKAGNDRPPVSHSAPGPVIGVGLPVLVALGGYLWYRHRQGRGQ